MRHNVQINLDILVRGILAHLCASYLTHLHTCRSTNYIYEGVLAHQMLAHFSTSHLTHLDTCSFNQLHVPRCVSASYFSLLHLTHLDTCRASTNYMFQDVLN